MGDTLQNVVPSMPFNEGLSMVDPILGGVINPIGQWTPSFMDEMGNPEWMQLTNRYGPSVALSIATGGGSLFGSAGEVAGEAAGTALSEAGALEALQSAGDIASTMYGGGYMGSNMLANEGILNAASNAGLSLDAPSTALQALEQAAPAMSDAQITQQIIDQAAQNQYFDPSKFNAQQSVFQSLDPMQKLEYAGNNIMNGVKDAMNKPGSAMKLGEAGMKMMNGQQQQQQRQMLPQQGGGIPDYSHANIKPFAAYAPFPQVSQFGQGFNPKPMSRRGLL